MTFYNVGKIVNTQGLRGEVRIISVTDFAQERYQKGQKLVILDQDHLVTEVVVSHYRRHKNFDVLTFENHGSINDVERYKGMTLAVDEVYLSELDDDEFYFHEIIGLPVFCQGEQIGHIKEILSLASNDVWVIQRQKQKDVLVPYIADVVTNVDIANKRIEIAEIEGLMD